MCPFNIFFKVEHKNAEIDTQRNSCMKKKKIILLWNMNDFKGYFLKRSFLTQTGESGVAKNPKSGFFLLRN